MKTVGIFTVFTVKTVGIFYGLHNGDRSAQDIKPKIGDDEDGDDESED